MKRAALALFAFSLFFSLVDRSFAALDTDQLAENFTQSAMAEFKSVNDPQLSYAQISSRIKQYALKMAEAMSNGNVNAQASSRIMQNAAKWYGQALESMFQAGNFNEAIQGYVDKVANLFVQENLSMTVQETIISSSALDLENMNSFFQDLR